MSATEKNLKELLKDFQYNTLSDASISDDALFTRFNLDFPESSYLLPIIASYRFLVQLQNSKMSGSPPRDEKNTVTYRKLTISPSASLLTVQAVNFELGSITRETYHATLENLYHSQKKFIFDEIVMRSQKGFDGDYEVHLDTLGTMHNEASMLLPRASSPTADKEKNISPIRTLTRNFSEIFSSPRKKSPSPPPSEIKTAEISKELFLDLSEKYTKLLQEFGIVGKSPRDVSTNHWVSSTPSLKKST